MATAFIAQILSKAGVNCISPETPYGDNPFWQEANEIDGNYVAAASGLLAILINDSGETRTLTIPAPMRHDGQALATRNFDIAPGGNVYGVLFDPAYAGNQLRESLNIFDTGDLEAQLIEGVRHYRLPSKVATIAGEPYACEFTFTVPAPEGNAQHTSLSVRISTAASGGETLATLIVLGAIAGETVTFIGSFVGTGATVHMQAEANFSNMPLLNLSEANAVGFVPGEDISPNLIRFAVDGSGLHVLFLDVSGNAYVPPFQPVPGT